MLDLPVIAAGGIGNARGFAAALALGAEGVVMGTRFLLTEESPIHPKVKEWELRCNIRDTAVVQRTMGNPHRALKNQTVQKVMEMEERGATFEELRPLIGGEATDKLYHGGDIDMGTAFVGQVVELITELKSCKEVIDEMVSGAQEILGKLGALTRKA